MGSDPAGSTSSSAMKASVSVVVGVLLMLSDLVAAPFLVRLLPPVLGVLLLPSLLARGLDLGVPLTGVTGDDDAFADLVDRLESWARAES